MRLVSLDLSKSSTGIVVCEVDDKTLKVLSSRVYTISVDRKMVFGKASARDVHFVEVDEIMKRIEEELSYKGKLFCIAESPVYHSFSSELTYYIFQSMLNLMYKYGVDVLSITPMMLKKYVGWAYRCCFEKDFIPKKKTLDKKEIRLVYEGCLEAGFFANGIGLDATPQNDDEMDAFFLMCFLLQNMSVSYLPLMDSGADILAYESLRYVPMFDNSFNGLYMNTEFFSLKDKKFYPNRYFKKMNLICSLCH